VQTDATRICELLPIDQSSAGDAFVVRETSPSMIICFPH
jgi:hypothetical protein